jgi:hypothetical protein
VTPEARPPGKGAAAAITCGQARGLATRGPPRRNPGGSGSGGSSGTVSRVLFAFPGSVTYLRFGQHSTAIRMRCVFGRGSLGIRLDRSDSGLLHGAGLRVVASLQSALSGSSSADEQERGVLYGGSMPRPQGWRHRFFGGILCNGTFGV